METRKRPGGPKVQHVAHPSVLKTDASLRLDSLAHRDAPAVTKKSLFVRSV
jgi:hypothetical protein